MGGAADRLLIHECTRGIKQLQRVVANAFGLPQENVRIVCPFIGGALGRSGFQWSHTLLAAAAAKLLQRPVKLDSHSSADVRFGRPTRADGAEAFRRRGQKRESWWRASPRRQRILHSLTITPSRGQHVTHVVFLSECRGLTSARLG